MLTAQALQPSSEMPQDIRWMNAATAALAVVAVLLVLAAGFTVISRQPYFVIHKLSIDGEMQRNNMATVRANVVPRVEGSFFMVDLARAKAVFESVPWVRQALVRRVWPNELRVTLEEHKPAAYWRHEDRDDQLVNQQGEVFDANLGDVEDEPLPTLQAPANASAGQARLMLTMLRKLQPVLVPLDSSIDSLKLTDRGSWTVKLDNDAVIELGRGETDELVARAERFVRTLPQLRQQYSEPLAYADLRYPHGYAVRLKGLSTVQNISKERMASARQTP
ncbi:MAG: cell division protein FtsQ/DivIB [Pseudomonadota bacterium]|jgi:cell division protein FtsQ|uniref:cell division protein FtsQ/DivIB n=1 Tax=Aquabacterium sp. TaxID=1872578 RepID=UPI003BAED590